MGEKRTTEVPMRSRNKRPRSVECRAVRPYRPGYEMLEDRRLLTARVIDPSPQSVPSVFESLSSVSPSFDKPIDLSSFTTEDVELKDPVGQMIEPVTITPVAGSGDTQFTLRFPSQTIRGKYCLSVGPEISDLAGNPMNQDGDPLNGEASDAYHATIQFAPTTLVPAADNTLHTEGVEDWSSIPTHWSFETTGIARFDVVASSDPP